MSQVDRLAATLAKMQRDIRDLQRAPQLQNSSVDGGIEVVDPATGKPVGVIGLLPDGTPGVGVYTGPIPPRPTPPRVITAQGGLTIEWDGRFLGDDGEYVSCPGFKQIEIYVYKPSGNFDPVLSPNDFIYTPGGGRVTITPLAIETKFVVMCTRNTAGGLSVPSNEVSGMPGSFVSDEEIAQMEADRAENQAQLVQLNANLETAKIDLTAQFGVAYEAATTADEKAQAAANAAANAKSIADIATGKADAAQQAAGAAQLSANGKNKVFYSSGPPTASAVNDVWFDSDDDNKPYRWDGSQWVAEPLGNAAIGNLDAAKITTGYLAAGRIDAGTIQTYHMTANSIDGDRIRANTLHADKIQAETIGATHIATDQLIARHIRARQIQSDKIEVGAITTDLIDANAVTAQKVAADAITGKIITGGMFRTGYPGQDRVEIINELQYDQYLQHWRELRDTIRWLRGEDGALVGEIRGYMGDIGAYGLHLNSHVEIGNTQSVIYQVGKRKTRNNANPRTRVRAGVASPLVGGDGGVRVDFEGGMDETPSFILVTPLTTGNPTSSSETYHCTVRFVDNNSFILDTRIISTDPARNGRAPGQGTPIPICYYAEITV